MMVELTSAQHTTLEVLEAHEGEWLVAEQVAALRQSSKASAGKHLKALAEFGVLETRRPPHDGQRGSLPFEYRVRSDRPKTSLKRHRRRVLSPDDEPDFGVRCPHCGWADREVTTAQWNGDRKVVERDCECRRCGQEFLTDQFIERENLRTFDNNSDVDDLSESFTSSNEKLPCPACRSSENIVLETRIAPRLTTRRRHSCQACEEVFFSIEC